MPSGREEGSGNERSSVPALGKRRHVVIGFKCPATAGATKAIFMTGVIYAPIHQTSAFLSQSPRSLSQ
jgi:hypothetical protein